MSCCLIGSKSTCKREDEEKRVEAEVGGEREVAPPEAPDCERLSAAAVAAESLKPMVARKTRGAMQCTGAAPARRGPGQEKRRATLAGRARPARRQRRPSQLNCNSSFKYKDILAARSVPILFILISFLVIANTRCDQVGSANVGATAGDGGSSSSGGSSGGDGGASAAEESKSNEQQALGGKDLEALEQQETINSKKAHKSDSLHNMLREIYLDSNSKIITMLMPESEQVQKFHPNGRYGRRSVDNLAESHAELGKLIYNNDEAQGQQQQQQQFPGAAVAGEGRALMRLLRNLGRGEPDGFSAGSAVGSAHSRSAPSAYGRAHPAAPAGNSGDAQSVNYQLEMNKLLKCNYTGVSNLYWCDSAAKAQA